MKLPAQCLAVHRHLAKSSFLLVISESQSHQSLSSPTHVLASFSFLVVPATGAPGCQSYMRKGMSSLFPYSWCVLGTVLGALSIWHDYSLRPIWQEYLSFPNRLCCPSPTQYPQCSTTLQRYRRQNIDTLGQILSYIPHTHQEKTDSNEKLPPLTTALDTPI